MKAAELVSEGYRLRKIKLSKNGLVFIYITLLKLLRGIFIVLKALLNRGEIYIQKEPGVFVSREEELWRLQGPSGPSSRF